jgi:hypothetical protein
MDKSAAEEVQDETLPAALKVALVFKGISLSAALVLLISFLLRLVFSPGPGFLAEDYLKVLILFSSFGLCAASWISFLLDIMYGLLSLMRVKARKAAADFFIALLSLLPLGLALAERRLASGFGP